MDSRETVARWYLRQFTGEHGLSWEEVEQHTRENCFKAIDEILALLTPEAEPVGEVIHEPISGECYGVLYGEDPLPHGAKLYLEPPSQGTGVMRKTPGEYPTFCPECGFGVATDEDGLCIECGCTAIGAGVDALFLTPQSPQEQLEPVGWLRLGSGRDCNVVSIQWRGDVPPNNTPLYLEPPTQGAGDWARPILGPAPKSLGPATPSGDQSQEKEAVDSLAEMFLAMRNYEDDSEGDQPIAHRNMMERAQTILLAPSGDKSQDRDVPWVVCICGSTRFADQHAVKRWELEQEPNTIVLMINYLPAWYADSQGWDGNDHFGERSGLKEHLDELHLRKIDMATSVYVVNPGGYVGNSTAREINYARTTGKPVEFEDQDIHGPGLAILASQKGVE